MNRFLLICALAGGCLSAFAAKVETIEINSPSMQRQIKACVVLPDSYAGGAKRYPVVYLLHGWSGNYESWVKDFPELKDLVDLYDLIVVSPDGAYSSWYFDSPVDKSFRYETFAAKEVVERIDAGYATITNRTGRAISGLSMGGHGALYLSFRHQEVFGAAASMSGGVDFRPFPGSWNLADRLGDYATHKQNWEDNTVINLVYLLKPGSLALMIDCGTSDFFYAGNKKLHEELLYRNIQHDYIEREGVHNLDYWRNSLPYHMLFFNRYFHRTNRL
jgi:S-formylglutathione hydrolase FrmB